MSIVPQLLRMTPIGDDALQVFVGVSLSVHLSVFEVNVNILKITRLFARVLILALCTCLILDFVELFLFSFLVTVMRNLSKEAFGPLPGTSGPQKVLTA